MTRRTFLKGAAAAGATLGLAGGLGGWAWHKRFGALPSGARRARILASPHYRNGAFQNEAATPVMAGTKANVSMWDIFAHPKALRQIPRRGDIAVEKNDLHNLPDGSFVWFGHSSYLFKIRGKTVLVDPVFYRGAPIPFVVEPFPGTAVYHAADLPPIDVLLITHDHWDHLEYATVCELRDRVGTVVCPLGVGAHFEYWGYAPEKLVELDWYEAQTVAGLAITCLPSRHFSGRGFTRSQTLWASFMVDTVYFAGDGGYDGRFRRIAEKFPRIDLAVLENGQYNAAWSKVHTLPQELPQIVRELKAARYFFGHNSKFSISLHAWDEPQANQRAVLASTQARGCASVIGRIQTWI